MSDRRRWAAGVVATGFEGESVPDDLRRACGDMAFAGVVLFARNLQNVEQTRALTDEVRATWNDALRPIIAIDQEGGRVARLRAGVEEVPSMMALAACDDVELARRCGEQLGFDLRRAGVNVDFAPVLDLALHGANTVIGARSFGDDPERVAELAGAFAGGLEAARITATYKHFPGHGSTAVDSHLELPTVELARDLLTQRDLVPFARCLPSAHAVMTAHVVLRAFDDVAATLSHAVLTGLLREELGFPGVCFTDCLQMHAIARDPGSVEGAIRALRAGADCVLVSHSVALAGDIVEGIVQAVESGALSEARLGEAYERVARLRAQLCDPLPLHTSAPFPGIGIEAATRAVTLLRGEANANAETSVAVSFEGTTLEGVQGLHAHHAELQRYAQQLQGMRLPLEPSDDECGQALRRLAALGRRPILLVRRAHVYGAQRAAVARMLDAFPDAVLVSLREPYDTLLFQQAQNVVCTYGDDEPSMAGLARVLFDGVPARGSLPVTLGATSAV